MSRDQRPRRDVMVDSAPELPESATQGVAADPALPPPVIAKSRTMLWSMLFLLACAGGATGASLLLAGAI